MKIHIAGAGGGLVTGSAYYIQAPGASILVDCGQFQGTRQAESLNRWQPPSRMKLDAVLLTHAHLDHTGRLPLLIKNKHRVPVYATEATIEMTALILRDSARILAGDAEHKNRKRQRAGEDPLPPLYSEKDAEEAIRLLRPVPYQTPVEIAPGVRAIWAESGHMLGSASIQLLVEEGGREKKVVFSGDLGPRSAPILRTYEPFHDAEMVFMESTYGTRDHRPFPETVSEFVGIVNEAVKSGGKILVPTFAVGRTQLIAALLGWMFRNKKAQPFPIFMDSPMAIQASEIYARHRELFDDEALEYLAQGSLRDDLRTMKLTPTADDSRKINNQPGPCLVMAGAGMCNAGRILHHFKANLWKPEAHVLIVGYQGVGTLGRQLVDGADAVKIYGEKIAVKANIHTLGGFSAHAGKTDLLNWLAAIAPAKPRVILTHGEEESRIGLETEIQKQFGLQTHRPQIGDVLEL